MMQAASSNHSGGFFFGLEKKNGQKKVIHTLLSDAGQELMEPSQIRRRAVEFYSSLYSSEYEEEDTLQEKFCSELPQVSTETSSQLEEPLQLREVQAALQSMQGRRAPGIDGLTVEFYKAFWEILSTDILDVFNESLASGPMPMSCRRAVLTLLPKKGNLQDIKNWRPVSLLCVDYKLLSKALANRLRGAMEQEPLIHGARLDVSSSVTPGLTGTLCKSEDPQPLEAETLRKGEEPPDGLGGTTPDPTDPFPDVYLNPELGDLTAPLLTVVWDRACLAERAGINPSAAP
ncbi:hypothetical protein L3Q82_001510 [Scortum barcoo]|uniref:Uncharacterized protein n=1 Tax=Scortum barcoo TaxID=214431 RepID=A0ACB8W8E7_9TELE|nr:hypothetical protein L3Q82_001510 [Scortum barcoo]